MSGCTQANMRGSTPLCTTSHKNKSVMRQSKIIRKEGRFDIIGIFVDGRKVKEMRLRRFD